MPAAPPAALAPAIRRSQQQRAAERAYLNSIDKPIQLNNVAVLGQRAAVSDPRRLYPASATMTVVDMNTIPSARTSSISLLQALQSRIPGVSISGTEPNMTISMRGDRSFSGNNTPLILLDGVRTTISALAFYQAADVERVEIMKPGQATIFGSGGADGVVAVYTRRGSPTYNARTDATNTTPDVLAVRLPGYDCPQQFYAPRYGADAPAPTRPDTRRATLYWAPSLRTDASGQTEFTFYTAEAAGSFRLSAEGISTTGQPALGSSLLEVKE
ncbi:MAG: hypothetical protein EOO59_16195 [Hymenobacter sp.]|nr:MAG: hypothetical protein EOO59_16195 [Hymenobacter sp.]